MNWTDEQLAIISQPHRMVNGEPVALTAEELAGLEVAQAEVAAEKTASAWRELRAERDRRLAASDVMVLPDRWAGMPAETQVAWTTYRQGLRDLPEITLDPTTPVWPVAP